MKRTPICCGLLFATSTLAQQDATTPTFQADTKLVEVNVVARSKGAPAKDLKKEDFRLTDNGRPQKIAFFSVRSATSSGRTAPETPLPPGTYSNRLAHNTESAGRTTVILLDQINTPQALQAYVIPRIRRYLEMPHGADRLAIYTITGRGLHVVQDLTGDRDLLKRAARKLSARDPDPRINDTTGMSQHEAESYAAMNIMGPAAAVRDSLKEIARHLAKVPGRKTVAWVTTAFRAYDLDLGLDFRPEIEQAAQALNNANAALYPVDARGLMGVIANGLVPIMPADARGPLPASPRMINRMMQRPRDESNPPGFDTEQMLSSLTGGQMFFNKSNAIEESIETAAADGDFTYTLGFYPDESTQDSKWHDIKVGMARPGVRLRYRTTYFARRDGDAGDAAPTLDQILREPLDSAQIELRAEADPDPARPGILNLKVNIDLRDVAFIHTSSRRTGTVDLSFYLDGAQRIFVKPLKIEIPDDHFNAILEKGLDAVAPIDIRGRAEALRIVAQDKTTGAVGSLTIPVRTIE